MSFTNINDPVGVKALLDQLRASQAWQQAIAPPPPRPEPQAPLATHDSEPSSAPSSSALDASSGGSAASSSVAALLSQLQSTSSWTPSSSATPSERATVPLLPPQPVIVEPASPPRPRTGQDPKLLTFQQALPYLARLGDDSRIVAAITRLKKEQDDLERQLWEDRRDVIRKYEERVKVATTKANMIGDSGISKHEADMLQDGLKRSLEKFDRERVLVAWDGLISKQQTTLAQHSVPIMFPTIEASDRERQQRVMQVLEGILQT